MLIDLLFLIAMVFAVIKGLQRGFIIALFSIVGWIIGLAAAMKLSTVVAAYLDDSTNISAKWLPFISFILVFIAVVFIVQLGASLLHKTAESMALAPLNRLGGIVLYVLLYSIVFSIVLFFAIQMNLVTDTAIKESRVYPWVQPIGPFVINSMGNIIPFFQDMFKELQNFFQDLSERIPEKQ
jgi:membrane protein required for colicin V production